MFETWKVANCVIEKNSVGIGIDNCLNNVFKNNTISFNLAGFYVYNGSSSNIFSNNKITSDNYYGILMYGPNNNMLNGNLVSETWLGVGILESSNISTSDSIMENNGYYIEGEGYGAGMAIVGRSENIGIVRNSIEANTGGIAVTPEVFGEPPDPENIQASSLQQHREQRKRDFLLLSGYLTDSLT